MNQAPLCVMVPEPLHLVSLRPVSWRSTDGIIGGTTTRQFMWVNRWTTMRFLRRQVVQHMAKGTFSTAPVAALRHSAAVLRETNFDACGRRSSGIFACSWSAGCDQKVAHGNAAAQVLSATLVEAMGCSSQRASPLSRGGMATDATTLLNHWRVPVLRPSVRQHRDGLDGAM